MAGSCSSEARGSHKNEPVEDTGPLTRWQIRRSRCFRFAFKARHLLRENLRQEGLQCEFQHEKSGARHHDK